MTAKRAVLRVVPGATDSPESDAFGRWRVSTPETIFDSQLQYDKQPLIWDEWTTGSASTTHLPDESAVSFSVGAGESVHRQTFEYHRYQPGKSQFILCTGVLGAQQADITKRFGYFDDDNGFFVELTSDGVGIVKRSKVSGAVVDTRVEQADWNESTIPYLDVSMAQILFIDLEWLGVGRVRAGFVIDGCFVVAHEFLHANNEATTYMTTANLPVKYEVISGSTGTSSDFKQICCSVISEGGQTFPQAYIFSAETGAKTATATELPILSFRPKATFNSIVNRAKIEPMHLHIGVTSNDLVYRVYYDATVSGGSWVSADASSITEYNATATGFSGGIKIDADYVLGGKASGMASSSDEFTKFPLTLDHAGLNPKNMLVTAQRIGTTDADLEASFQWRESR